MKQIYSGVDIGKLIFAVGVVIYHIMASFYSQKDWQWFLLEFGFIRMSVPFFFMASGFFLGSKLQKHPENRRIIFVNQLKRLAFLYAIWGSVSICISLVYSIVRDGRSLREALLSEAHRTLLLNNGVMWYVGALFLIVILLYFLDNEKRIQIAILVGAIVYVFGLLLGSYSGIFIGTPLERMVRWYYSLFLTVSNAPFLGLYFTVLGFYIGAYPSSPKNLRHYIKIIIISYLVLGAESWILSQISQSIRGAYENMFYFLIAVPAIFHIALRPWKGFLKDTGYVRFASGFMYFTHIILIAALNFLFDLAPIPECILVITFELILAAIIYQANNPLLNKLF